MAGFPALINWKETFYFLPRDAQQFIPGMPPQGVGLLPPGSEIALDQLMGDFRRYLESQVRLPSQDAQATPGSAGGSAAASSDAGGPAQGGSAAPAAGAEAKRLAKPTAVEMALKPPEKIEFDIRENCKGPGHK